MATYRILSLDGGGIRGLMTAVWLTELEKQLGAPLRQHFDLVAGTSTGSILACGVSHGIPAEEIVDMYVKRGRDVFPGTASRLWSRVRRTFREGVSAPKYSPDGLQKVLKRVFKEASFGKLAIKPTLVTSYNTLTREAIVFKNTKAAYQSLKIWEVCTCSSAAPTFFPAHVLTLGRRKAPMIDGGVVANNPTGCAIAEGLKVQRDKPEAERAPLAEFVVASFGTGATVRPIEIKDALEWGALEWAIPIIDVLFDGAGDAVDYIARQMIPESGYFRFQTELTTAYDDMDNADETNLNALMNLADMYLRGEGADKMKKLVSRLKAV